MSRILLLCLSTSLVLLGGAASVAAHEPTHAHEVDPLLRSLFLISTVDEKNASAQSGQRDQSGSFALSDNASAGAQSSRVFTFSQPILGSCLVACSGKGVEFAAAYAGEDFEVEHADSYDGVLHFAWSYRANSPISLGPSMVGYVDALLMVNGEDYGHTSRSLSGNGGDVVMPLSFAHSHECEEGQQHVHNGSGCYDSSDPDSVPENQTVTPVYAHDFVLTIRIQPVQDTLRNPTGGQLQVKLDAMGGSFVQVREVPPPAPEPVELKAVQATEQEIMIEGSYEDVDGDGEVDPDELHFVPCISPALLVAVVGLVGLALRRLRK